MPDGQNITRFPTSRRERRRLLRRSQDLRVRVVTLLRGLTGWVLAVSIILFIAANHQLFTPQSAKSIASYLRLGLTTPTGNLNTITYASGSAADAALFSGGLALADSDTLYVAVPGGLTQLSEQLSYQNIVLDASDDLILAYDRGGVDLSVSTGAATVYKAKLTSPILSASMGADGSFAVITDEQGYKNAITVFNNAQVQTYKWSSSEYYIQSAALSPSGKKLAALAFCLDGASLRTRLLQFDVGEERAPAEVDLGGALGLEAGFLSENSVAAVCDTGVFVVQNGKVAGQTSWRADDLLGLSFASDGVAVAVRSYSVMARAEITVLDAAGAAEGPLPVGDELQSLSLSESGLAVLTTVGLNLYGRDLTQLWTDAAAAGGRRVLLQADGVACVLFGKEARLFTANRTEGRAA